MTAGPSSSRPERGRERMNIAITAGLQLNPPGFGAGLAVWSRENSLTGEAT